MFMSLFAKYLLALDLDIWTTVFDLIMLIGSRGAYLNFFSTTTMPKDRQGGDNKWK